jgi:hypothetical protein
MRRALLSLASAALALPGAAALALLAAAMLSLPAAAAEPRVPIRPGQWKISTRVTVSVAPIPRIREINQCIERDTLHPDELTGRSTYCDNVDAQISGSTLTWKITCREEMTGNTGEGRVSTDDDSLSGEMKLRGIEQEGGERMVVTTTWQGERLGECE